MDVGKETGLRAEGRREGVANRKRHSGRGQGFCASSAEVLALILTVKLRVAERSGSWAPVG